MKFKDLMKKMLANTIGKVMFILIIIAIILVVITYNKNKDVDMTYIMTTIEKASELTTAKINYTGFYPYKDEGIAIINKSNFIMVYEATARTGINVKDVKVSQDKLSKTIWLTIPKAEILEVKVNPNEIKYYDKDFALFNLNKMEDANKAQAEAEKRAKKELNKMGILETADKQAETLIKGLIQDAIPNGYEIKVKN